MKNKAVILCLWITALAAGEMDVYADQVFICNPFEYEWSGPVDINLSKMKLSGKGSATVKDESGKLLPSQTDDLDFDGKADETVVLVSLKPLGTKILTLSFSPEGDAVGPFAEPSGEMGLKCAAFELKIGPDGRINSLSLLQDGRKFQIVKSSNLHVWRVDNTGWEQKSAKLAVKRKIGHLRAVYDIIGDMHGVKAKGQMVLHRQIKVYPDSRIDNAVEISYQSGNPFFTGNKEGGIRSTIECDAKTMYQTLSWDFGNKLKIAEMKKAWSHMRRVPGGIIGGFMDSAKGCGIISMPDRDDSSLRLWDNRTTYIPGTPKKQMLIVNGLGWWGKNVTSGNKLKSGWRTYAFFDRKQAEKMTKTMIETQKNDE